jgi:SAM-dependent methyltransferase
MFDGPYHNWNQTRIKAIVEYYGHQFFFDKKILDLGCGHGDISGVLHRLGADVTAVDARQEHLKTVSQKYNGVKTVKADLDQPWPFFGKTFDLTLDLALLCHLNNFHLYNHLKAVCTCSNYLILETAVLDSNDPEACIVKSDNKNIYDGSFNGFSSQISAANIERLLTQYGMNFQRLDQTKFNSPPYSYDWHSKNDNSFDINKRRIWFCIKNGTQHQNINPPANVLPAIHGGTLSPHLTDSKMPLSHQKMMTTASAVPPKVYTPPPPPVAVFAASLAHQAGPSPILGTIFANPTTPPTLLDKSPADYKIAILISGHLRVFEKTIKSTIKNMLGGNRDRADFFIHTWETLGVVNAKPGSDESINKIKTDTKIDEINSTYNPKLITIDKYDLLTNIKSYCGHFRLTKEDEIGFPGKDLINYFSMLFSFKQVFQLMEEYENKNNIKYDIIIKYRPDIIFTYENDIIQQKLLNNTIYQPNIANYFNNGMNDQFAFGDHNAMENYSLLYDKAMEYIKRKIVKPLRPETLLRYHLINSNINIHTIGLYYYLLRANGTVLVPLNNGQVASSDANLIKDLI